MSTISPLLSPESDSRAWNGSLHFSFDDLAQYLKQKVFAASLSVRRQM
jgi:hypothetical protein